MDSIAAAFIPSASASALTSTLASASPYDLALITVKAYDTANVIAELRAIDAGQLPPLLTLQNGVGNEEALIEAFGADRIVSGAIDTPVSVPAPGQVQVHRERFKAGVAPVGPGAPAAQAAGLLRDAGFTVDSFADYRRLKWSKLLMNLLTNAQCAILDWTPAQVMADPAASRLEAVGLAGGVRGDGGVADPAGGDGGLPAAAAGTVRPPVARGLAGAWVERLRVWRSRQQDAIAARRPDRGQAV